MNVLDQVLGALSAFAAGITGQVALALVAAGTISMAALQVIKELSPWRIKFQRGRVEAWLRAKACGLESSDGLPVIGCEQLSHLNEEIVELAAGGSQRALYNQAPEDLALQIMAASQIVLDEADEYRALLRTLSHGASAGDIKLVLQGQPSAPPTQPYFDARNRVTHRIQRNVDGLRMSVADDWKWWMQLVSISVSTMVVLIAVAVQPATTWGALFVALPIGIVGGYLAPVTRDLLAALQKLRDP